MNLRQWQNSKMYAAHIKIRGIVQGVGFRPFVYRLALNCEILGHVKNDGEGVEVFAQGARVEEFLTRLEADAPPMSRIHSIDFSECENDNSISQFEIIPSKSTAKTTAISPDLAICPDCIEEINNPAERRFKYPFTNCTNCGPRFSIIEDIPYDRAATTMRAFNMCPDCQAEYGNPLDRRFHAQPIACPNCGPKIWFSPSQGSCPKGTERGQFDQDKPLGFETNASQPGRIAPPPNSSGEALRISAPPRGGSGSRPFRRFYPAYLKEFARDMRKNPTDAERKVWNMIRNERTGHKFRRQFAIDAKYIADFVCLEKRLIIEIDGGHHNGNLKDRERTFYLESHNFRVIRFWNNEVLNNPDGCLITIKKELGIDAHDREWFGIIGSGTGNLAPPSRGSCPEGTEGGRQALTEAVNHLKSGKIIAVKGLSGFHLVCDATNENAVSLLRQRKRRPHKPMAIMLKSVVEVREWAKPNESEIHALEHFSAPIVLINGKDKRFAPSLAPNLNQLGMMIAATPLHYLICQEFAGPLVMTSGNLSGEPMVIDNDEAIEKLSGFVDGFLFHDRDIARRIDDSVVYVENDEIFVLRRARGFAPTPIHLPEGFEESPNILAMGAQMKSSICLLRNDEAIVSHYIGELGTSLANSELEKTVSDLSKLYDFQPEKIATDLHPQYFSTQIGTRLAEEIGIENIGAQHHHAHIAAVMAENNWGRNQGKVLGLVFDGTGFGTDGTIWGGEFIIADYENFERVGHISPIRLPGGHAAINEPWRLLVASLFEAFGAEKTKSLIKKGIFDADLAQKPIEQILAILERQINAPVCTSMGRLFDSVACALGIAQNKVTYEAQAAIELENSATDCRKTASYLFENTNKIRDKYELSTQEFWRQFCNDIIANRDRKELAFDFHYSLAKSCAKLAKTISQKYGIEMVVLTGGVMQNRLFSELLRDELKANGLSYIQNRLFPANDGSIALGQALIAAAKFI